MKYLRQFESVRQFVEFAKPLPSNLKLPCSSIDGSKQFTGTDSREEAFEMFLYKGYPEGKELMQLMLSELTSQIRLPSLEYEFVPDVEGCAPDVEAYLQGSPYDMIQMQPITLDAPPSFLTIQLELAYRAGTDVSTAALAGAIIFAAMEGLRLQGCHVEMIITYTSEYNYNKWQGAFPINSTLDIDTAGFIFTHPSMLRRIVFGMMEQETDEIRKQLGFYTSAGYGHTYHLQNPRAEYMISIPMITNAISATHNRMEKAKDIFQNLVASKFKSITSPL